MNVAAALSNRRTITISTIVSILSIMGVILPLLIAFGSPWLTSFMSSAVAGEINEQVERQVTPINAAMKVLIESQIATLEDEIAALEYRRERSPAAWTEADAQLLRGKERRLTAHREALTAMAQASLPQKKKPRD